ncbi:MAG TPA: alkaline phosphatase D family protein [Polyangiaceae bacterium]|nr:alkaline phosphatase D family protein [Polyangiaceae bacterium]
MLPLLPGCENGPEPPVQGDSPFLHGVASGDPLADRVILWTRVTAADSEQLVRVEWQVALDPELRRVVSEGTVLTGPAEDFTVKVDAEGLKPGRKYYYRFAALGHISALGCTCTLALGHVERLRLAVVSCSNYAFGFFNAYAQIAARGDVDLVLHLGDYLYEYENGGFGDGTALGRIPAPDREILTLEDYRERHAQYKTDPDLQELHRLHPWLVVWDDHESANDAYRDGAENHQPATEGDWQLRKAGALQAYHEWMPIRSPSPDSQARIYRSFACGDLADLILLDTRLIGRDQQVADACDLAALSDPARSLLGAEQEEWFLGELERSQAKGTRWRLVGQQVMMGQLLNVLAGSPCPFNVDQWDGYGASRARVFEALSTLGIDNVVVLTGDIHSSWALDLTPSPFDPATYDASTGRGSLAVEFITPAVTSPGIDDPAQAAQAQAALLATHPHLEYTELNRRGYLLLDVNHERVAAEWYHVRRLDERNGVGELAHQAQVRAGDNHLSRPGATPGEALPAAAQPSVAVSG